MMSGADTHDSSRQHMEVRRATINFNFTESTPVEVKQRRICHMGALKYSQLRKGNTEIFFEITIRKGGKGNVFYGLAFEIQCEIESSNE